MKKLIALPLLLCACISIAQEKSLEELLNYTVGGVWISTNENNDLQPESYASFFMEFKNWSSNQSVTADIFGVKNNGDTSQLIEIWNYINPSENNIFLVQRTAWGAHCTGTITPYEGKHLDIVFKTTNSDGSFYWTRDIHYAISENEIRAETYFRLTEEEQWEKSNESLWKRQTIIP